MGYIYVFIIAIFVLSCWLMEKHDYSKNRNNYALFWAFSSTAMVIYPLFMDGLWKLLFFVSMLIFVISISIESMVYYRGDAKHILI